jgi:hypothetical protein
MVVQVVEAAQSEAEAVDGIAIQVKEELLRIVGVEEVVDIGRTKEVEEDRQREQWQEVVAE